ncbi:hypothetical protein DL96DRAFT_1816609 [Flagelloscypha sp. PMI_526]|nr:hypothetical protein DL96DRAFT_1816609 [Flagelloscypha sp. PMI_526]
MRGAYSYTCPKLRSSLQYSRGLPACTKNMENNPILPQELEQRIFLAAADSTTSVIGPLLLVAHRVREWVEPCRFEMLVFPPPYFESLQAREQKTYVSPAFYSLVMSKDSSFVSRHVKHISFYAYTDLQFLLSNCVGLTDLRICIDLSKGGTFPNLEKFTKLTRLTLNGAATEQLSWFVGTAKPSFSLPSLSHLIFHHRRIPKLAERAPTHFPNLTHLMTDMDDGILWVSKSINMLKGLIAAEWVQLLVVNDTNSVISMKLAEEYGKVIIMHMGVAPWEYESIWKNSCRGENDLWAAAEDPRRKSRN